MHANVFFSGFLKNWKEVGSPLQTSRHGAKKICDVMDFSTARRIVEVGSGTGSITREILKLMRPDAELIVFETNRDFCRCLNAIGDHRLIVHNTSGFELADVLTEKADYVISEIPIATLPAGRLRCYYEGIKTILHDSGACIQLQISLMSYRRLKQLFKTVRVEFTLRNSPPLFIYLCRD